MFLSFWLSSNNCKACFFFHPETKFLVQLVGFVCVFWGGGLSFVIVVFVSLFFVVVFGWLVGLVLIFFSSLEGRINVAFRKKHSLQGLMQINHLWVADVPVQSLVLPTEHGRSHLLTDLLHPEEGSLPLLARWSCLPSYPTPRTSVHLALQNTPSSESKAIKTSREKDSLRIESTSGETKDWQKCQWL